MKTKLKALGRFIWDTYRHDLKVFVDTAPLMEKPAAQAVGHGWQGKHTNLVSRQFGSWLFLGEMLLRSSCRPTLPRPIIAASAAPASTSARPMPFPAPYRLDARRCISYLTIEHEGPIDASCGRCSATASMAATIAWRSARGTSSPSRRARRPWCRGRRSTRHCWPSSPRWTMPRSAAASPAPRSSASAATVSCATSPMRWATALCREPRCRPSKSLLDDPSPLVRGAAVWALSRLAPDEVVRTQRMSHETDAAVCAAWIAARNIRRSKGQANEDPTESLLTALAAGASLLLGAQQRRRSRPRRPDGTSRSRRSWRAPIAAPPIAPTISGASPSRCWSSSASVPA